MSARAQHRDEQFVAFVDTAIRDLRRTAFLLCGDWGQAEDAVQNGLIKVYLRWHKLDTSSSIWGYARRAVVTSLIDEGRRMWRRREQSVWDAPDFHTTEEESSVEDRELLRAALEALPRRQRAVVILRYVDDLDVTQTAFVLDCPPGTVTSSTARALAFLKEYLTLRGVVRGVPHQQGVARDAEKEHA